MNYSVIQSILERKVYWVNMAFVTITVVIHVHSKKKLLLTKIIHIKPALKCRIVKIKSQCENILENNQYKMFLDKVIK